MSSAADCQCSKCLKYLVRNREPGGPQLCVECVASGWHDASYHGEEGIALAQLRECLQDPLSIEILGLMTEECGETSQRIGKILRWGWDADFEGTTQRHKLEVELGDIVAAIALAVHNGLITRKGLHLAMTAKIDKLLEDARGPRQRLQVASVPDHGLVHFGITQPGETVSSGDLDAVFAAIEKLWSFS